jgi:predicted SPOUT superfamily RNA methylase MTH1
MTLSVLIPSSVVREAEDKREATRKLGYIARSAAVFRADHLIVFPDRKGERQLGGEFVETVLRYAATPPHLRKKIWGRRDELEYVGVLPPLRVSSTTGSESTDSGSLTQGIVTEVGPDNRVRVNCELQHPVSLHVPESISVREGTRVAIRISSREPVRARIVDTPLSGFDVSCLDLVDALDHAAAGITIATSRHGEAVTTGRLPELTARIDRAGATIAFGAPGRGLPVILGDDNAPDSRTQTGNQTASPVDVDTTGGSTASEVVKPTVDPGFDLWLNTIPQQGSKVVRTEEAMFASLALLTITE